MTAPEVQLHRMARQHHATMQKLDSLRDKIADFSTRGSGFAPVATLETGAGAWVGGLMDGRLQWSASMGLVLGSNLLLLSYLNVTDDPRDSVHFGNVGKGFLSGTLARAGYRFGQRMRTKGATS